MQAMQTRRRLFAVLAALSIATALIAGCSSGSKQSGAPLPDATTLVKQSTDTTKNLKSAHLVLSVIGKIPGLPIKTLTGDLTNTPATAASGNVQLTLGGLRHRRQIRGRRRRPLRHADPEQMERFR